MSLIMTYGCDFLCDYQLDRFIPNRSAMDFDYAHYMLTEGWKGKENPAVSTSPSREAYRKQLAETFNMNRTRILAFKSKPPTPVELIPRDFFSSLSHDKPTKPKRIIPQVPHMHFGLPSILKFAFSQYFFCWLTMAGKFRPASLYSYVLQFLDIYQPT